MRPNSGLNCWARPASGLHERDVQISWVSSEGLEGGDADYFLSTACGIVIPGGFGPRGVEGMIQTARYAREKKIPYLGLYLGMQVMVIEAARSILNHPDANSTEFNEHTAFPVIDLMPDQRDQVDKGGTMRLGNYPCKIVDGTWA